MSFNTIKSAVAAQFQRMQQHQLYRVDIDKDALWTTYLASYPIYRQRTEHDCSCCRHFIRSVGDVVAVIDGELVSIWDIDPASVDEEAYIIVANALSDLVKSRPILSPFLHYEPHAGTDRNFELDPDARNQPLINKAPDEAPVVKTWTHFHVNINKQHVAKKDNIPTLLSARQSQHDVFLRSLQEITDDAIDTVLELISQNSLYRGEEHRTTVLQFKSAKDGFSHLPNDTARDIFAWTTDLSGPVTRIRNTAIGTLLVDLSEGRELEESVRSFEAKVASTSYKRPSALITKGMIEKAKEKVEELGLTSALERRYATLRDVNVSDILFADRTARKSVIGGGDAFDDLSNSSAVSNAVPKNLDRVEEVPIDKFIADIIPRISSIEVLFENRHYPNLVSLIAPMDATAGRLFKWDNNFSWSYNGEVADAIKERVKQAGGSVEGDLCCRLAWSNFDDLDLHMQEPGGYEIFFPNKRQLSPNGGMLDVDMNVSPTTREPVENIYYKNREKMREGTYHLFVHQYNARERDNVGFECQIDYLGTVLSFSYNKPVRHGEQITVAKFKYTHKGGMEMIESLPSSTTTREVWGISTQVFHRVNLLMMSPNYWSDHPSGNKHYFFMLDGCKNDGGARGFYNEFLDNRLDPHRKVFEVLASKMKPAESPEQLSGLGFSSTRKDTVTCRVKGSFSRIIRIAF